MKITPSTGSDTNGFLSHEEFLSRLDNVTPTAQGHKAKCPLHDSKSGAKAKAWLEKLSEVNRKRTAFQDMAAEDLITFDELRAKLAALEETREIAERELAVLEGQRESLEQMERDKDAILEHYVTLAPEALDSLSPEERRKLYNMLRLRVFVYPDEPPEVEWEWELPDATICKNGTMETRSSRNPRRMMGWTWIAISGTKTSETSPSRPTTTWVLRCATFWRRATSTHGPARTSTPSASPSDVSTPTTCGCSLT